ncbi:MAG TPA: PASTA domain-containing protein [Acidimicrobiales bacterium]|jgi:hypothetical protein|nr:PASTA domain-containing protein [Acidimicrobiales bacterium]
MFSVALVAAVTVGTIGSKGHSSSHVQLSTGSAWFPSPGNGTVALIDGQTVTRVTQVPVAKPGQKIQTVQAGSGAYVLNQTSGQATRVDGALLAANPPVTLGTPGDDRLALLSNGTQTWAVERSGTNVQQLDPRSLVPVGPLLPFPGSATGSALTPDGDLWVLGGSRLISYGNGRLRTQHQVPGGTTDQLVVASGHPVVVDQADRTATEYDASSGKPSRTTCFDANKASDPVSGATTGTPFVFDVSPSTGTLLVSDLKSGNCSAVVLTQNAGGDQLGTAIQSGNYAFIPDYTAGTAVIVDLQKMQVAGQPQVQVPGSTFQLLPYNGAVWFDDVTTDFAGIVTLGGTIEVSTAGGSAHGKKVPPYHRHVNGTPPAKADKPSTQTTVPANNAPPVTIAPIIPPASTGPSNVAPTINPPSNPSSNGPSPTTPATTPGTAPGQSGGSTTTTLPGPPTPTFSVSPNPGKQNQPVTFVDTTPGHHTDAWTFGGGASPATSTSSSPTVTWSTSGTFTVQLTITTTGGARASQQQIQIAPPNSVPVPDISGETVAEATSKLQTAGLKVGSSTNVYSDYRKGDVASSNPAAGTAVPQGSSVGLNISEETGGIATYATGIATPARSGIDNSGNLYVPSNSGNVVYKVTTSGQVSTFAGNGTAGNTGDGGLAPFAELNAPISVAVDPSGDVYIAEQGNNDIREVSPLGVISTLVSSIQSPWDLTWGNNTLYAVDRSQAVVYSVAVPGGALTAVVGGSSGTTLNDPSSLTIGPNGGLYITEPHAEQVVEYLNGALTVVAGTGGRGYTGDGGPATAAELADPDDVVFDASGDIFENDWGNCAVREITPDGIIQTVAGTGTCGNSGDGGAANSAQLNNGGNGSYSGGLILYGSGTLFISDTNNNVIREVSF